MVMDQKILRPKFCPQVQFPVLPFIMQIRSGNLLTSEVVLRKAMRAVKSSDEELRIFVWTTALLAHWADPMSLRAMRDWLVRQGT
jgi:hypothetical protein